VTLVNERQQLSYIASQAADARLNVELETEGMTLNIGPQHPATHGTLRIIARLDGEQVVWAEPVAGYMHRGYEKLTEVRTFPQVTTLINRIDWLGSFANEVPFILAAEQLMEIEAPSTSARSCSSCRGSPTSACSSATSVCSSARSRRCSWRSATASTCST
jgi:NADH-quinone oxidoreductase subunit D